MKSLAVVTTHPIQYYSPVFQLLAKSCRLKVFYTWGEAGAHKKYDPDFKKYIEWDIPLLEGYDYEFLKNTAKDPGSHHFFGIKNPNLIDQIQSFHPDAVLLIGWSYLSHLNLLNKLGHKIPIWFKGDSHKINHSSSLKNSLRKIFLKWVYSHINHAFYVGTLNKNYFEHFGLKESQLTFGPHAVDNDRFSKYSELKVNEIRNRYQIAPNHILILFAGKLEANKNPKDLLDSFKKLKQDNVHLLFVGNGNLESNLKINASNHPRIHFHDFVNQTELPDYYWACNLFCLPSKSETWGLAVNEAMAAGKPILVSDQVGCAQDLIKPGINGEIFQTDNVNDLLEKLNNILNLERLVKYGQASKAIIQNWSFNVQTKAILKKLYESN